MKPSQMEHVEQIKATCYHEAGHAVAAYALEIDVDSISRNPGPDPDKPERNGVARLAPDRDRLWATVPNPNESLWNFDRFAMTTMAGAVAEMRVRSAVHLCGSSLDRVILIGVAKRLFPHAASQQAWIDFNWHRVVDLIANVENWPRVESVAYQLMLKPDGTMNFMEILSAIHEAKEADEGFVKALNGELHAGRPPFQLIEQESDEPDESDCK
jgi:hypothetical protein